MYCNFCLKSQITSFIAAINTFFLINHYYRKKFKIIFTTLDKFVQDQIILFVILRFSCRNSDVTVANIENCNFITEIGTVSKILLVRLAKDLKAKPGLTSRGVSRNSEKVHVSKRTMELARKCQKTKK